MTIPIDFKDLELCSILTDSKTVVPGVIFLSEEKSPLLQFSTYKYQREYIFGEINKTSFGLDSDDIVGDSLIPNLRKFTLINTQWAGRTSYFGTDWIKAELAFKGFHIGPKEKRLRHAVFAFPVLPYTWKEVFDTWNRVVKNPGGIEGVLQCSTGEAKNSSNETEYFLIFGLHTSTDAQVGFSINELYEKIITPLTVLIEISDWRKTGLIELGITNKRKASSSDLEKVLGENIGEKNHISEFSVFDWSKLTDEILSHWLINWDKIKDVALELSSTFESVDIIAIHHMIDRLESIAKRSKSPAKDNGKRITWLLEQDAKFYSRYFLDKNITSVEVGKRINWAANQRTHAEELVVDQNIFSEFYSHFAICQLIYLSFILKSVGLKPNQFIEDKGMWKHTIPINQIRAGFGQWADLEEVAKRPAAPKKPTQEVRNKTNKIFDWVDKKLEK